MLLSCVCVRALSLWVCYSYFSLSISVTSLCVGYLIFFPLNHVSIEYPCLYLQHVQRALGEAIVSSGAKLESLDLSDNAFGPDGVEAVRDLLVSPAGYSIQRLRFHNNGLGPGGGKVRQTTRVRYT